MRAASFVLALCLVAINARAAVDSPSPPAATVAAVPASTPVGDQPAPLPAKVEPAPAPEPVFDAAASAPYFNDKTGADAVQALVNGHASTALKLLPKDATDLPTRFVRAQAMAASGDDAGAAREFESLAEVYTALAPRCHCAAATSFEAIGDYDRAATHWAGCASDPQHARTAPISAAKGMIKLNRWPEALPLLLPMESLTGWGRAEAMLLIGQILENSGREKEALDTYRKIYVEEPLSVTTDKARDALRELAHKMKVETVTTEQQLDRIDRLLTANQPARALRELGSVKTKPLCTGDGCKVKRCDVNGAEAVDTAQASPDTAPVADDADGATDDEIPPALIPARKPRPFTVAGARDDEDAPGNTLKMPACVLPPPAKPADPLSCRAQLLRGWAQSHEKGTRVHALNELRVVYARCADPDIRARALFYAQGIAARVGDGDAFDLALVDALQFPENSLADDGLLAAGEIARNLGDGHAERQALRLLVSKYSTSDQRAEGLFRLFWSFRTDGRPDRGLGYLDTLSAEYENGTKGDGGDAERGRYWWGRTVSMSAVKADRPRGVEVLTKLAHERPTTYYGLLARSFLASVAPSLVVLPVNVTPYPGFLRLGLLANDKAFTQAVELYRMGELREAHDLLALVNYKALRLDGERGLESSLIVAELLLKLGDQRLAHSVARRELLKVIREGTDPLGRRAAMVCYPLAFRGYVSTHATSAGFAPDFLQGLMREESALDPHAESPVGARGLTQLMPETARQVARSIGLRGFSLPSLWEPDTNIRIGSIYLGRMLKQFGHPGLAAAAYNAGPGAVSRWLATAKGAFDEFVEQIPFNETRGYVKRVLRSYAAYSYLYEQQNDHALQVSLLLPPSTGCATGERVGKAPR